jgi:hypothetical protein
MITRKIGLNRGKRRLWLEGEVLSSNSFYRGDKFTAVIEKDELQIYADPDGNRTIAGTADRPIIDINSDKLFAQLGWESGDQIEILSAGPRQLLLMLVEKDTCPACGEPVTDWANHEC